MSSQNIPFNIPYLTGKEMLLMQESLQSRKLSGDGPFTLKCQQLFEKKIGFPKTFLTTSCTDALEMAALLINIKPGDEVILPSFTFVSTANAFLLRGAQLVFADSSFDHPNIAPAEIEKRITPKTKAVIIMHYAGMACDMEEILKIVQKHDLYLIEDAALGLGSFYQGKPLGSFGHFATFSFHETKNISCGEGGMLVINDERFVKRAEIVREKGTNRSAFFRGEIDKYGWADIGSSFLSSDILAAFLYAQLEGFQKIQELRLARWNQYYSGLSDLHKKEKLQLPVLSKEKIHNASVFYFLCNSIEERTALITHLRHHGIHATFHYQSLHRSGFYPRQGALPEAEKFSDRLLRLPLYPDLTENNADYITSCIGKFYQS